MTIVDWELVAHDQERELASLRQQLAEAQEIIKEQRQSIDALNMCVGGDGSTTTDNLVRVSRLEYQLAEAQSELAAVERELAEAKKTLEWLYRWIGHKPLSECVRKVSDTLQAMREGE